MTRRLTFILAILLAISVLIAMFPADKVKEMSFTIEGMECGGCAERVRQALLAVDGVQSVEVAPETGTAKVKYRKANFSELEDAIRSIGFEINEHELKSAPGTTLENGRTER